MLMDNLLRRLRGQPEADPAGDAQETLKGAAGTPNAVAGGAQGAQKSQWPNLFATASATASKLAAVQSPLTAILEEAACARDAELSSASLRIAEVPASATGERTPSTSTSSGVRRTPTNEELVQHPRQASVRGSELLYPGAVDDDVGHLVRRLEQGVKERDSLIRDERERHRAEADLLRRRL